LKEEGGGGRNDQNQENEIDELEDMEYLGPGFDSGFFYKIHFFFSSMWMKYERNEK